MSGFFIVKNFFMCLLGNDFLHVTRNSSIIIFLELFIERILILIMHHLNEKT